ncbi:MAG: LytR/AlgR family response regulator transcription factor [Flammeovirgaceae bacterium]
MRALIIEDETNAAEKIQRLLRRYDPSIEVVGCLESISSSIDWLQNPNHEYDLILSDIQLTDGLSFDIFKQVEITKPIIFTTAFDEYALEAFKLNSIAYLLKPVTLDALAESMDKLETLKQSFSSEGQSAQLAALQQALGMIQQKNPYKERFMVKLGDHIRSIPTHKISFFYAEGRNVFLITDLQRKFIIDYKLEDLEGFLDPKAFYRVNRSFIVNIQGIKEVLVYSKSRLKVELLQEAPKEIIVSREKVSDFKDWFNGV